MTWNPTFKDRMDFYGVTMQLCRLRRAQTKGEFERSEQYAKCNALAGKRFADLDALNA